MRRLVIWRVLLLRPTLPGRPARLRDRADRASHERGLVEDLPPAEAEDAVAQGREERVAGPVLLECGRGEVVLAAVGLDHKPFVIPEEVDLMTGDGCVHRRTRHAVLTTQPQEGSLEVAAGD